MGERVARRLRLRQIRRTVRADRQGLKGRVGRPRPGEIGHIAERGRQARIGLDLVQDRQLRRMNLVLGGDGGLRIANGVRRIRQQRLQLTFDLGQRLRIRRAQRVGGAAERRRGRIGEHRLDVIEHGMDIALVHAEIGRLIVGVLGVTPEAAVQKSRRIVEHNAGLDEVRRCRQRVVSHRQGRGSVRQIGRIENIGSRHLISPVEWAPRRRLTSQSRRVCGAASIRRSTVRLASVLTAFLLPLPMSGARRRVSSRERVLATQRNPPPCVGGCRHHDDKSVETTTGMDLIPAQSGDDKAI